MPHAYYQLSDRVEDGTKCTYDSSDICINGHCRVGVGGGWMGGLGVDGRVEGGWEG